MRIFGITFLGDFIGWRATAGTARGIFSDAHLFAADSAFSQKANADLQAVLTVHVTALQNCKAVGPVFAEIARPRYHFEVELQNSCCTVHTVFSTVLSKMLAFLCIVATGRRQSEEEYEYEEEELYEESPVYPDIEEFDDVVIMEEQKAFYIWYPLSKIICVLLVVIVVLFSCLTISALRVRFLKKHLQMD